VSPDIFGRPETPPSRNAPSLPPATPPVQPWVLEGKPERRPIPAVPPETAGPLAEEAGGGGESAPPSRRRGRRVLTVTLAVALILFLGYLVPAILMSGKVLPGTTVSGVDIGGLTVTEAAERLRARLDERARKPIVVQAMGIRQQVYPEDAGLSLDVVGTIEQAPSGFPNPIQVVRALIGEIEIQPEIDVQTSKLTAAVQRLAQRIDRPVREGEIRFKGLTPQVVTPRDGRRVEVGAAVAAIRDAYFTTTEPVTLPVTVVKPTVGVKKFTEARIVARRAVSAPFTLVAGFRRAELSRQVLAANLTFVPAPDGEIVPRFNAKGALAAVEKQLVDPAEAPVDPTYDIVNGEPKIVPGRPGRGVDAEKLADAITKAIREGGSRTIEVTLTTVKPRLSENELRSLGIREKISEFTTSHPCCQPRVTNIHRIADILDGYIVKPGEVFSLNGIVGPRDRARGFVEAPQIVAGRLVNDVGGGISQFVTTMYNAVFFGGLKDVKHTPHEFYISRYPAGRESTVSYPEPDFKWQNDSPYGVLVKAYYTDTSITVQFWSTKRYDKVEARATKPHSFTDFPVETDSGPDCIPMAGRKGFTIEVTRVFYRNGTEVKRDPPIRTVYRPETRLTCVDESSGSAGAEDSADSSDSEVSSRPSRR